MVVALIAEVVDYQGSVLAYLLTDGRLTVKESHGVLFKSFLAGIAEFLTPCAEIVTQSLLILRPAGGTADGVYIKLDILQAYPVHQVLCQCYNICISLGVSGADHLTAELVELSESALLDILVSEA